MTSGWSHRGAEWSSDVTMTSEWSEVELWLNNDKMITSIMISGMRKKIKSLYHSVHMNHNKDNERAGKILPFHPLFTCV